MHPLTELIRSDMKPALGVTEPGAIAYAVCTAGSYLTGDIRRITLRLNSGIYKNAFTCGIPNSSHYGNLYAAALGAVAGDPEKGLECLAGVTEEDNRMAEKLVDEGRVTAEMSGISSRIYISATVQKGNSTATAVIRDVHTNITRIEVNGMVVFGKNDSGAADTDSSASRMSAGSEAHGADLAAKLAASAEQPAASEDPLIHQYSLEELVRYADTVDIAELDFIREAFRMNMELFEEGKQSARTTYLHYLLERNGGEVISKDEAQTAALLCSGAIEARVLGLDKPAMSITGSGSHGIIATLPLYAAAKIRDIPEEKLLRATALSFLICMYIKEYSGRLSAFCGCGIAAGTGMSLGLVYLTGGGVPEMTKCLNNMASGITGMICDGGNHGCAMKALVACDSAFRSAGLAMNGAEIESIHGINGMTPEDTMRNMGRIASPGMVATEGTIVDIMQEK